MCYFHLLETEVYVRAQEIMKMLIIKFTIVLIQKCKPICFTLI